MKRVSLKLVAILAFFCFAAITAYAQPAVLVSQYTVSCPGSDWLFWWANTQYSQTALVLFDPSTFTWKVLDLSGPTVNPRQIAPVSTSSGHSYVFQVMGNLPPGTQVGTVWTSYTYPSSAVVFGGTGTVTLSCS